MASVAMAIPLLARGAALRMRWFRVSPGERTEEVLYVTRFGSRGSGRLAETPRRGSRLGGILALSGCRRGSLAFHRVPVSGTPQLPPRLAFEYLASAGIARN
ncbi:MAG: hypothetical protein HY720_19120 [Planctomycetes bacterium]|nr:hypothetical protein [Planctomycetota bacterium]